LWTLRKSLTLHCLWRIFLYSRRSIRHKS